MTKINFIAIKKYPDKKEMHVFTKDGKEEVYPVSDGKEKINDNFRHLKELANQNEIPYSVKGLRELRRLGLVYYLEEKEFDRLYPVMSQGNKNQAQSQKKKEYLRAEKKKVKEYLTAVQKNPNLLLDSRRNPYFDTRKFYEKGSNSNGKEKQLPQLYKGIHDFILPREVPKTSFIMIKKPLNEKTKEEPLKMYVFTSDGEEKIYPVTKQNMARQLSKLAQENELSYSSKGLRELRRLGLLYYLEEEDFNQLYPIMSQKNKNQAQYQKKKEKEAAEKQLPQIYFSLEEMIKRRAATAKNTTSTKKNADDLDSTKVREFKSRNSDIVKEESNSKSKRKARVIPFPEKAIKMIKKGRREITYSVIGTIVAISCASFYNNHNTDRFKVTSDMLEASKSNQKVRKYSTPAPFENSTMNYASNSSIPTIKTGAIKEYQNIKDALQSANINEKKKLHLGNIYSWLTYYNDSFADNYYNKKEDTKPAHRWEEAITYYLLYNHIDDSIIYKIFDNSTLDTDQLLKSYKKGIIQDAQAYIISEDSLKMEQLINSEKGKEFYKIYKKLFNKYKSLTEDSKHTKEEVTNTFSKLVREDFLTVGKEITPAKLAVFPIINAFYELASDIDTAEKLSEKELDYVKEKVFQKVETRLSEYSNGLIVNKNLYENKLSDALSYSMLKKLALRELKENDNYKVEEEQRNLTTQKAYQTVLKKANSDEASSESDYASYYKTTQEVKGAYRSSFPNDKKDLSKKEDIIMHGSTPKEKKNGQEEGKVISEEFANEMRNIVLSRISTEFAKTKVKRR